MGLHNPILGPNPDAPLLLRMLGLDINEQSSKGLRYRDVYVSADGSRIILFTRNGGGNREHDDRGSPPGEDCTCRGCWITYTAPKLPYYTLDRDDEHDSTYAYVEFTVSQQVGA